MALVTMTPFFVLSEYIEFTVKPLEAMKTKTNSRV